MKYSLLVSVVSIVSFINCHYATAFQTTSHLSSINHLTKISKNVRTKTFLNTPSNIFNEVGKNRNLELGTWSYSDFLQSLKNHEVTGVSLFKNENNGDYGIISIDSMTEPKVIHKIQILPDMIQEITNKLSETHVQFDVYTVPRGLHLTDFIFSPFSFILIYFIFITLLRRNQMNQMNQIGGGFGGNNNPFQNNKNIVSKSDIDVGFNDVAGCDEAKGELTEIVDFLKAPEKYINSGAKIPKGVLLEGSPGTGKTLMAKAVAGEANVPFFSVSGSEFIEIYVGVGASRVRNLFKEAKENSPCVVFIDEIDAIGRQRGSRASAGNDEREQTLNQILTEMDGFKSSNGTIVLAATNRIDILDSALTRPGRFDRKVTVPLPNEEGRKQIFKVHTRNKKLDNTVDFNEVASLTQGFSGADLENLANEAAILSVRYNMTAIDRSCVLNAYEKITIGLPNTKDTRTIDEKRLVALHEIGHAMLVFKFSEFFDLRKVTIRSNQGGAGGYCLFSPKSKYTACPTQEFLLARIVVLLGGRAAEILSYSTRKVEYKKFWKNFEQNLTVTTGASNDLKQAYRLAKSLIVQYGFGENQIVLDNETPDTISEKSKEKIDKEVSRILTQCAHIAQTMIKEDIGEFYRLSDVLIRYSTIDSSFFSGKLLQEDAHDSHHFLD